MLRASHDDGRDPVVSTRETAKGHFISALEDGQDFLDKVIAEVLDESGEVDFEELMELHIHNFADEDKKPSYELLSMMFFQALLYGARHRGKQ